MRTLFELKNPLPFDQDVFDRMHQTAKNLLSNAKKEQYTEVVVLLTTSGKEYAAVIANALSEEHADEKRLTERMIASADTEITQILCMWQDGDIDLPSGDFRYALSRLNPSNGNAGIFVMTKDGYSVVRLNSTIQ